MKRRDFLCKTIAGVGAMPAARFGQWVDMRTSECTGHSPDTLRRVPALLPLPQDLTWTGRDFTLDRPLQITYPTRTGGDVKRIAGSLAERLRRSGARSVQVQPEGALRPGSGVIRLALEDVATPVNREEACRLHVTEAAVHLKAPSATGLFWGVQTLRQLLVTQSDAPSFLAGCEIEDWPAFTVRGLMHDTGRNYVGLTQRTGAAFVPLGLLKEQIQEMARYKMNLFHWHLTEDIAWRLEIEQYPQLTRPDVMLRNKGQYYTQAEARELIAFARAHHVTILPEIDMPGHSDAFERAMGVSMQSDEGRRILKDVLREVCAVFEGPCVHLGTDEVEGGIDPNFLPEMIRVVRDCGKEAVAWKPGGDVDDGVVRQLWTGRSAPVSGTQSIDSRHLYLNHNDPLSGVVKTFNRQICDADRGTNERLGGIMCIWNDRRPAREADIMLMNGVYPQMLAFSERAWRGGGRVEPDVRVGAPDSPEHQAFVQFENRLITHGKQCFGGKPFPYVRQAHVPWTLIGPFSNEGDLSAAFFPEWMAARPTGREHLSLSASLPGATTVETKSVAGGTIWLRHCFAPYVTAHLSDPEPNSTIYAITHVHADREREAHMWISFHNPSRSESDDTAPLGRWDYKHSKIWLNGEPIDPPQWSKPGRQGHDEAPYIDESYEYRAPTPVMLEAGWNRVLVKAPIGDFASEHTRLVKWMFTAVLVEWDGTRLRALDDVEYAAWPKELSREEASSEDL